MKDEQACKKSYRGFKGYGEKRQATRAFACSSCPVSANALATTWIACVAGAYTWTNQWRMSQKQERKFFSRSGNSPISELQSWTKTLGTILQYSYFSVISRFPLKTVHPFRNFLAVLPSPTLYKVETQKKFWIHQSRIVIKFDNHVTSQHGGHFKSREFSYSPFFIRDMANLIRCKLVRYPWFCSARPWSFTCFKMADVYHAYWSKFPSQGEASIRFLLRDQVCFFHFVVKFNVLVDFCERCKKSAVISKVYAFDSACFYCSAQSLNKVHQVFLFSRLFQ